MLPIKPRLLPVVLLLFATTALAKTERGFLNRTVTIGKMTYRYQVYVPANWNKDQKWPIILFLHGAGERGDDGFLQTDTGIGTALRRKNERFPAIVVMPQCRKDLWWTFPEMQAQALKALEQSTKEFNGDPQRTYLTGLSMGGYGSWVLASQYPNKFAALVIICGGVRLPERLRGMPGIQPRVLTPPLTRPLVKPAHQPIAMTASLSVRGWGVKLTPQSHEWTPVCLPLSSMDAELL